MRRSLLAAIVAGTLAMPVSALASPTWQAPEDIGTTPLSGAMAFDQSGAAVVATGSTTYGYAFRPLGGPLGASTQFAGPVGTDFPYAPNLVSNTGGDTFAWNDGYPYVAYRPAGGTSFTTMHIIDSSNRAWGAADIGVAATGDAVGLFDSNGSTYIAFRPAGASTSFDLDHKITCCPEASPGAQTGGFGIAYDPDGGVSVVYQSPPNSGVFLQTYAPPGGSFSTPVQIPATQPSNWVYSHGLDGTAVIGWESSSSPSSELDEVVLAARSPGQLFGTPQIVRNVSGNPGDSILQASLVVAAGTDGAAAAGWNRAVADTTGCGSSFSGNFGYELAGKSPGTSAFGLVPGGPNTFPHRSRIAGVYMSGHTELVLTAFIDDTANTCENDQDDHATLDASVGLVPQEGGGTTIATTGPDAGNPSVLRWPSLLGAGVGPSGNALVGFSDFTDHNHLIAYEDRSGLGSGGTGGGSGGGGSGGGPGGGGGGLRPPGSLHLHGPIVVTSLGRAPISFTCGDTYACVVDAALRGKTPTRAAAARARKRKVFVYGRAHATVPAHSSRTISVRLTPAARKLLARKGKLKITVALVVRAGPRKQHISRTAVLKLPRKRAKH